MRLYRVAWVDPGWTDLTPEQPFHPLYVPLDRQGGGRFDNPHKYAALYAATSSQAAVGETFGNAATWLSSEITRQKAGRPRCLVAIDLPDDTLLIDLDDPAELVHLGLRPSDVVRRNRDHTQEVAQAVWLERASTQARGFWWWSYWRPEWTVAVLWSDDLDAPWFPFATVAEVGELWPDHVAVQLAADVLPRELS